MRSVSIVLAAILVAGCAGTKKRGVSGTDSFESAQIDQMVGNTVSGQVFERAVLCLNARREAWPARPVTNVAVTFTTNVSLTFVTNQSITISTNQSRTLATNSVPPPPPVAKEAAEVGSTNEIATVQTNAPSANADPAAPETNQTIVVVTATPPTTNETATTSSNVSVSKSPNQTSTATVTQALSSRQVTITTNNLSVTTADNEAVTLETNTVVLTITNQTVLPHTNVNVVAAEGRHQEYFLFTELAPPPDFTPATSGETLVLLVDGTRHGLTATNLQAGYNPRRGFTTAFYRVPPQLIEDIANAGEVRIRLRGVNGAVEKKMNRASRKNFKLFLGQFAEPGEENPSRTADARSANPPSS